MNTATENRATIGKVLGLGVLLAIMMLAAKPAHASTTFTVNSTEDHSDAVLTVGACDTGYTVPGTGGASVPECTLRAAMEQANYTSGADTINFAIPGGDVKTISPASQLPTITGPVSINGYSQPGAQPNTKAVGTDAVLRIMLSGAKTVNANGLVIGASNSTVKGLVINQWQSIAIRIDGPDADGNKITGNYLGTGPDGTAAYQGNYRGVYVPEGSNNTIGGTTPAARNVISNNLEYGVSIDGGAGTRVLGNYIGTEASGTQDFGNGYHGINIEGSSGTIIGGTTASERNVISGNDGSGVSIFGTGVRVTGNYIGTDSTGTKALENNEAGVYVSGTNNTVGGTNVGSRNVISANDDAGVTIYGAGTSGNRVLGNFIGTDKSGTQVLGNADQGVFIGFAANNTIGGTTAGERNIISANGDVGVLIHGTEARSNKVTGNFIGADKNGAAVLGNSANGVSISSSSNNIVGGTTVGVRNVIADNDGSGVSIYGAGATGNRVLSNSIFSNGGLSIDLGDDGPTPNDPDDADAGPNNLQNKPVLSSARKSASGTTTVRGKLNSTPDKTFRVQFFSNPKGTDEGKTLLGSATASTNGSGDATFAFSTKKPIRLGQNITATATDAGGNTSEFSAPRTVVAP